MNSDAKSLDEYIEQLPVERMQAITFDLIGELCGKISMDEYLEKYENLII